ncbi:MAG TPA: hypothetical protein PK821_06255, partial [Victivallales bacterium]|nr:hypothetical protein [Victivallales bacterium]
YQFIKETEKTTTVKGAQKTETIDMKMKYKIYMLSNMSRRKFIEVSAHELAHDWMQANYPDIDDLAVKEGWAQYVAWQINSIYGHGGLNNLLEANKDPIYGDGFRMIKEIADNSSSPMDRLNTFFKQRSK